MQNINKRPSVCSLHNSDQWLQYEAIWSPPVMILSWTRPSCLYSWEARIRIIQLDCIKVITRELWFNAVIVLQCHCTAGAYGCHMAARLPLSGSGSNLIGAPSVKKVNFHWRVKSYEARQASSIWPRSWPVPATHQGLTSVRETLSGTCPRLDPGPGHGSLSPPVSGALTRT